MIIVALYFYYARKNRKIVRHDKPTALLVDSESGFKLARKVTFVGRSNTKKQFGEFENVTIIDAFKRSINGSNIKIHLKFTDMSLTLPNGVKILDGVTGEIEPGFFTAIMGPSGAGKTTFLNVLMGKVARTHGDLFINEVHSDLSKFKQLIGYVPQEGKLILIQTLCSEN